MSDPLNKRSIFTLRHRVTRLFWNLVWKSLASWTPAPFRLYRVALVRLFGGRVDWTANIYGSARIWYPPNLTMEPYACLGPRANCYCMAPIRLAARCVISQEAELCGGTHDVDDPAFALVTKPINVGPGAWVAAGAFIGPGVSIGQYAVVGARAVLFKDAQAWGIYAGNPAKWIRDRRFVEPPAETLLKDETGLTPPPPTPSRQSMTKAETQSAARGGSP